MISILKRNSSAGFTLLESLLAIGILSVVIVQVVSVQSSNVAVSQISRDNMRATWAMRQAVSQLEYVLDALGASALPKTAFEYPWPSDDKFSIRVEFKEVSIEASRLLVSALKIASVVNDAGEDDDEGEEKSDPAASLKQFASLLDSKLPKDLYRTYQITVSWKDGDRTKSVESGGLIIDEKVISGMIMPTNDAPPSTTGATATAPPGGTAAPRPTPTQPSGFP